MACAELVYITGLTEIDGRILKKVGSKIRGSVLRLRASDLLTMQEANELKQKIKTLMVENLMLQVTAAEIGDDQLLFGPGSLGLDSVDALQLVVMLDKNFALKIPDPGAAKEI